MKILVTGANGFIGKNLIFQLKNANDCKIFICTRETSEEELDIYCRECDFIFHLAGVQRPENNDDFMKGNFDTTFSIIEKLKKYNNLCPIMLASSTQAVLDNFYGISKRASEELLLKYSKETGTAVYIYRFTNIFGKWGRPNFNSAVTTFCYNVAHGLPITINDPSTEMNLIYIDDVIKELISIINGTGDLGGFCSISPVYKVSLGRIVNLLGDFKWSQKSEEQAALNDDFSKKLFATYMSYLP